MEDRDHKKYIYEDETIDDLQCGNLVLIQKKTGFKFGIDAVLLANFVKIYGGETVLDIGTGTGIIPTLLTAKSEAKSIVGIDIQENLIEMAKRSAILNGLEDILRFLTLDIKDWNRVFKEATFDVITTNPPYVKKGGGLLNISSSMALSKHELTCSLEDIMLAAGTLLKNKGRLYMVHRPDRLCDIFCSMRACKVEPKSLRFVHPYDSSPPNLVLIGGIKNANPGVKIERPLFVYKSKHQYSDDINMIYRREVNK